MCASERAIHLRQSPGSTGNRSVVRRSPGAQSTRMDVQRRQIGPGNAKTAHCARVSVVYRSVFIPCSGVCRSCIGGGQAGSSGGRRMTIRVYRCDTRSLQQFSGPRLTAKIPERACCGVPWHACISDAWGVKTEAAPGGQDSRIGSIDVREIDVGEPGGGEPPRRLSGRHCGAHRARRCRAKCRRAPQERLHECRERCERQPRIVVRGTCAGIGAAADALMRSMVQRRVTRQRNGAATAPKAEARSAMPEASGAVRAEANAPAIGEVPGSKSGASSAPSGARRRARREARARMRRCRATDVRKRKRAAPPPERRRGPRCAAD